MAGEAGPAGFFTLIRRAVVDSTNDEAKRLLPDTVRQPFVVWADAQTAGRGRRGRAWKSPPGNLFASFVVWPRHPAADWPQASFAASLAVADVLDVLLDGAASIALKWPNDVLIDGLKTAGILLESADGPAGSGDKALIIGFGLNIGSAPPVPMATTCLAAHGANPEVGDVLRLLAEWLEFHLRVWETKGFAAVREAWLARAHGIGSAVMVRLANETLNGTFADLDQAGALVIDLGGVRRRITAGDVALLAARQT